MTTIKKYKSSLNAFALAALVSLMTPLAVRADTVTPLLNNSVLSKVSISNFEQVNDGILRGAAPSDKNLKLLAQSGVKTILDLRKPGSGVDHESELARRLGMDYIHIPLGFTTPAQDDMTRILSIMSDKRKQPVFLHCRQGADRTGMSIGMYRRIHDRWEFDRTYGEMRKHHFKPIFMTMKGAVKECLTNPGLVAAVFPPVKTNDSTLTAVEGPLPTRSN